MWKRLFPVEDCLLSDSKAEFYHESAEPPVRSYLKGSSMTLQTGTVTLSYVFTVLSSLQLTVSVTDLLITDEGRTDQCRQDSHVQFEPLILRL